MQEIHKEEEEKKIQPNLPVVRAVIVKGFLYILNGKMHHTQSADREERH